MTVYWNGRIADSGTVCVGFDDHGFMYGAGLFETFRTYAGKPFLPARHVQRLRSGCERLQIELPRTSPARASGCDMDCPELREILDRLLRANGMADAVFRYTVSAGPGGAGLPRGPYTHPVELIVPRPLPPEDPRDGIVLHVLGITQASAARRMKTTAYVNNLLAWRELAERTCEAADEGIVTDEAGGWVEGVVSNLWFITGDRIITAPTDCGVLEGVTRGWVAEEAARQGIAVGFQVMQPHSLGEIEGIFSTNAVRGLTPVVRVADACGGTRWEGRTPIHPVFSALAAAYRRSCAGAH